MHIHHKREPCFPWFIPTWKRYKHKTPRLAIHKSSHFVDQHSSWNICSCHRTLYGLIIKSSFDFSDTQTRTW
ncbi:hypothetical protein TNCV_1436431 [Trichonephila clavipes]|nr:hypothetical protein TNCV_1436431 [Trichonephila clavipes]